VNDIEDLIESRMEAIKIMMENLQDDLLIHELEHIASRHNNLIAQSKFWHKQNNKERYLYDLTDYAQWLFKYLGWQDIEIENKLNENKYE